MEMNDYKDVKMTDSEMVDAFKTLSKQMLISKIAIAVGFIGIAFFFITNKILFAVVMMIVFIGGASKYTQYNKQIKDISGNGVLKKVFFKLFDEVEYDHDAHYDESTIDEAGFRYPYHTVSGTDLVKGKYKDRDISLCDIELISTSHSRGSSHDKTVFHGLWVVYDLGKSFGTNLSILEMSSIEKTLSEKGFETGNEEFNKKYTLIADDESEGRKILTDGMIQKILDFDNAANAKSNVAFLKDGRMHVALNTTFDPFAVKSSDIDVLTAQYTAKIKVITDFIDNIKDE